MDNDGDQEIVFYMADGVGARYVDGPFKNDTNGISSDTFEQVVGLGKNALYPIMSYIFTLDGTDFSKGEKSRQIGLLIQSYLTHPITRKTY